MKFHAIHLNGSLKIYLKIKTQLWCLTCNVSYSLISKFISQAFPLSITLSIMRYSFGVIILYCVRMYTTKDFNPEITATIESQLQNVYLAIQKTLIPRAALYLKSNILYNPVVLSCMHILLHICVLKSLQKCSKPTCLPFVLLQFSIIRGSIN